MLSELGLIHMNGRIYDQNIGRFISADPFVQFPHSTQGYNRYAYVNNNPLSYTDPSGYFSWRKAFGKIAGIVGVALNFVPGCQFWCQTTFGAISGSVSGYLATGSFESALKSAVASGAAAAIGAKAGGTKGVPKFTDDFAGFKDFLNITTQAVAIFDQKAAARLALATGAVGALQSDGPLGAMKFGANEHIKANVIRPEISRLARKNGMSLTELNLSLTMASLVGNEIVGSRFLHVSGGKDDQITGFLTRPGGMVSNIVAAKAIGVLFDIGDTILAYQGLPTASSLEAMSSYRGATLTGHSLGAIDATNLYNYGYVNSARIQALPFGNVAATSNVTIQLGDPVSGMFLGVFMNPGMNAPVDERDENGNLCIHHQACGF